MVEICDELKRFGSELVIVDGALSRKTFASPSITNATILSTGAALSRSMLKVIEETSHTVKLLSLESEENGSILKLAREILHRGRIGIIHKDNTIKMLDVLTALESSKEIVEFWDANGFGFTNVNAKQQLLAWLDDSSFLQPKDIILKAMTIACANNKRKLNYIVGILKNWENESLLTVEEIDSYDENKKPEHKFRQLNESPPAGRAIPSVLTLDLTAGEEG